MVMESQGCRRSCMERRTKRLPPRSLRLWQTLRTSRLAALQQLAFPRRPAWNMIKRCFSMWLLLRRVSPPNPSRHQRWRPAWNMINRCLSMQLLLRTVSPPRLSRHQRSFNVSRLMMIIQFRRTILRGALPLRKSRLIRTAVRSEGSYRFAGVECFQRVAVAPVPSVEVSELLMRMVRLSLCAPSSADAARSMAKLWPNPRLR
mmetsp:Transcript_101593/g.286484  ORF Transcript_101593/g.286484 Transcript_101593/m.286484 type:complete len:203 (+) Transcript_101593:702-1310(+)